MPFPEVLAHFNKYVTNRFFLLFAGWVPPFAILSHTGRISGNNYRTPLLAFPYLNGFIFVLTYGRDVDWVKNLLNAGNGILEYNGLKILIQEFQFISFNEAKNVFPALIRVSLSLINVIDCLYAKKYI